jgi:ankyrin repeat protein
MEIKKLTQKMFVLFVLANSITLFAGGNSPEWTNALDCLGAGDLAGFDKALTAGGSEILAEQDEEGNTLLHYAVLSEDIPALKILTKYRFPLYYKNKDNKFPGDLTNNKEVEFYLGLCL